MVKTIKYCQILLTCILLTLKIRGAGLRPYVHQGTTGPIKSLDNDSTYRSTSLNGSMIVDGIKTSQDSTNGSNSGLEIGSIKPRSKEEGDAPQTAGEIRKMTILKKIGQIEDEHNFKQFKNKGLRVQIGSILSELQKVAKEFSENDMTTVYDAGEILLNSLHQFIRHGRIIKERVGNAEENAFYYNILKYNSVNDALKAFSKDSALERIAGPSFIKACSKLLELLGKFEKIEIETTENKKTTMVSEMREKFDQSNFTNPIYHEEKQSVSPNVIKIDLTFLKEVYKKLRDMKSFDSIASGNGVFTYAKLFASDVVDYLEAGKSNQEVLITLHKLVEYLVFYFKKPNFEIIPGDTTRVIYKVSSDAHAETIKALQSFKTSNQKNSAEIDKIAKSGMILSRYIQMLKIIEIGYEESFYQKKTTQVLTYVNKPGSQAPGKDAPQTVTKTIVKEIRFEFPSYLPKSKFLTNLQTIYKFWTTLVVKYPSNTELTNNSAVLLSEILMLVKTSTETLKLDVLGVLKLTEEDFGKVVEKTNLLKNSLSNAKNSASDDSDLSEVVKIAVSNDPKTMFKKEDKYYIETTVLPEHKDAKEVVVTPIINDSTNSTPINIYTKTDTTVQKTDEVLNPSDSQNDTSETFGDQTDANSEQIPTPKRASSKNTRNFKQITQEGQEEEVAADFGTEEAGNNGGNNTTNTNNGSSVTNTSVIKTVEDSTKVQEVQNKNPTNLPTTKIVTDSTVKSPNVSVPSGASKTLPSNIHAEVTVLIGKLEHIREQIKSSENSLPAGGDKNTKIKTINGECLVLITELTDLLKNNSDEMNKKELPSIEKIKNKIVEIERGLGIYIEDTNETYKEIGTDDNIFDMDFEVVKEGAQDIRNLDPTNSMTEEIFIEAKKIAANVESFKLNVTTDGTKHIENYEQQNNGSQPHIESTHVNKVQENIPTEIIALKSEPCKDCVENQKNGNLRQTLIIRA